MNKAVFFDRDGTINIEKNYLYRIEEFDYIDGAIEALKLLGDMGYQLVIVTNQSGIARGYYTEEDLQKLNVWMVSGLMEKGIAIAGIYYCPHYIHGKDKKYAIECTCRKPGTGLFWKAQKELQIDMEHSYAIGDKMRDISICLESSAQGILLETADDCDGFKIGNSEKSIWQCRNLLDAAKRIAKEENR